MDTSFYTAARGAMEQQKKMDVTANNIANVNTYGFKPKQAGFTDLMYYNLHNIYGQETPLKAGAGVRVEKTDTNFEPSGYMPTQGAFDYAIKVTGFFMLQNPINGAVTYSRNGHFSLSLRGGQMFLVNDAGNLVLDRNRRPITVTDDVLSGEIGVFNFNILDGMRNIGNNEYVPAAKNGAPFLVEGDVLMDHAVEATGVELAKEITNVIESQRAYSFALRMVQTSDEVVTTVNGLRQ